jgi:acyl-coenzyme A thioesterase PaaI-like protein
VSAEESPVDAEIAARLRLGLASVSDPGVGDDVAAAREVGQALRRIIERLTGTSAPSDVLREVTRSLGDIEDRLQSYRSVRSYVGTAEASGLGHDPAFFDWSPLLGLANPLAPPIRVSVEGETVVGSVHFGMAYEGPPGCVHGGYIAAAFDELLGLTQSLSGRVGMTGTLSVKYRRPTPLLTDLRLEGRVESVQGRKVLTTGRMLAGEQLTAEATGLFISIKPEDFRAHLAQREAAKASEPGA